MTKKKSNGDSITGIVIFIGALYLISEKYIEKAANFTIQTFTWIYYNFNLLLIIAFILAIGYYIFINKD